MIDTTRGAPHLADGDLIRYLDREVEQRERRGILRHLSACDACTQRLSEFGEQTALASRYLAQLDAAVEPHELYRARALAAARGAAQRPARRRIELSRSAAAVAAVLLATLSVQPVRAWVADRWAGLVASLPSTAEPVRAPLPVDTHSSSFAFEVAGEIFNLELEHPQRGGSVTLSRRSTPRAHAEVVDRTDETVVVLPTGMQVGNRPESAASYRIVLPPHIRLIQVFEAGRPTAVVRMDEQPVSWTHTVPLGASQR